MRLHKRNFVHGWGINDADYNVNRCEYIDGKRKIVWQCPFYVRWYNMVKRCYSEVFLRRWPNYEGCSICEDWRYFSNFKAWMETQDWEGNELDKDLLFYGNKIYSPETCVFVSSQVNTFCLDRAGGRGIYPIGVDFNKGKFRSRVKVVGNKESIILGYYDTPQEAHKMWLAEKLKQAYILASLQEDPRVAKALVDRYENYEIIS